MAAGLGFKTFNTGDVLSAADTNGYLMQGVLVFADSAARAAAITSPQEGQTTYLKDTDVIQVYSGAAWVTKSGGSSPLTTKGDLYTYSTTDARLAVGANGTTLVADSSQATGLKWATAAAGGMTLLSTTTLSGSTVTISIAANSYNYLQLFLDAVDCANDVELLIQVNGETGSTAYQPVRLGAGGQNTNAAANSFAKTNGIYFNVASDGFGQGNENQTVVNFWNPNSTKRKVVNLVMGAYHDAGARPAVTTNTVTFASSAVISSLDIKGASSNTFDGGTARLYGVS